MTAKEDGLWAPTTRVPPEDVRHLQNRVEEFRFTHVMRAIKDVESCAPCMARWITHYAQGSGQHGAAQGSGQHEADNA